MKLKNFKFENHTLSYFDSGKKSGDVILITHATGYNAGCYSYLIEELSKTHRVLALDFSGHGNSESSMNFSDWFYFRDQILALIENSKIHRITGIGHSLGGASLILAASARPDLFRRIIAFDPVTLNYITVAFSAFFEVKLAKIAQGRRRRFKNLELIRRAFRTFPSFAKWDDRIFEDYLRYSFRPKGNELELCCDPLLEAKIFRVTPNFKHLRGFYSVQSEVHIIVPEVYEVCPPGSAKKIASRNPKSTITNVKDATHFFPFEMPQWTLEKVKSLLN
ncbi:MAG: alpha/beta hydrolase [Leptospira sp.]|nr:alpha/beta hydrolase [Leptospira sp.]